MDPRRRGCIVMLALTTAILLAIIVYILVLGVHEVWRQMKSANAWPTDRWSAFPTGKRLWEPLVKIDPRNIELCDEATVAMYRAKTGPEKMRILDGMYRSAVKFVRGGVMAEHPDWSPEQIERETMLRIARGAD